MRSLVRPASDSMRYIVILFFSHLAVTSLAKESSKYFVPCIESIDEPKTNQLLAEFESLPKKIEDLLMPDMRLDNYSGELSASEIADGMIDNVRRANYELQQSMKSMFPFNGESILLDDDLQELTDQLKVVLKLTPDAVATIGWILKDDVINVCRMVLDDVYKKQHLVRSNVKPMTWKCFKDTEDRISDVSRS